MHDLRLGVLRIVSASACLLCAACASARAPEPIAGEPVLGTPLVIHAEPVLGEPLVIHGQMVPWSELRQAICEGRAGAEAIERAKLNIFVDEELKRRVESAAPGEVAVDEHEMNAFKSYLESEIEQEAHKGATVRDVFAKLFLPDDPDAFPPRTTEALLDLPGGEQILDHYREAFVARKNDPARGVRSAEEREFDAAVVQQVIDSLSTAATTEPHPVPGVLYRVNGTDIRTEDVWAEILPSLSESDVREAKQWLTNVSVLRAALEKAGAWLSDDEAEAAYHAYSDPFKDSMFSVERIAVLVMQFPSVERYKEYRRIYESFERMKAPEMTPEALEEQAQFRTNKVVGQVTVDVDVLLCAAYDFANHRWKPNGWQEAEDRMKDVLRRLVDEQKPWDAVLEEDSEWYEPPSPLAQRGGIDAGSPNKGRLRGIQRNNLLAQLGESQYEQFLNGSSIADCIFFEQEPGTLGAPTRGPYGWYLPRLIRRSEPPEHLPVDPDTMKQLVTDDYVQWNINLWTRELLREARSQK